jgi:hypothetical protein
VVDRGEGGGAAVDFDGQVRAAKGLAQRVARLLGFQQLDRRLAAVRETHLDRFAAIEIDGRKERVLRFVGPDQNRGDQDGEVYGVGSAVAAAVDIYLDQSSIRRPGTCRKSRTLRVTSTPSRSSTVAAMRRSILRTLILSLFSSS